MAPSASQEVRIHLGRGVKVTKVTLRYITLSALRYFLKGSTFFPFILTIFKYAILFKASD